MTNAKRFMKVGSVNLKKMVIHIVINVETIMLMELRNVTMETENLEMDVIVIVMLR